MKPITLATLPQATEQEVFNYVAHHLLTQNKKSSLENYNLFAYHGNNNLKNAAGCLIADSEYTDQMKLFSWYELISLKIAPSNHCELIIDLEGVHDAYEASDWRNQLMEVAQDFNLKFNIADS